MNTNDFTKLIVKLNRLTSQDQIKWQTLSAPRELTRGTDDVVPLYFEASYRGTGFALYERRYQAFDGDNERFYWTDQIVLAILGEEGTHVWQTVQPYSALSDLFDTVRRKAANVDDVLKNLLADDDDQEDDIPF